jgi:phage portal protein BeeE
MSSAGVRPRRVRLYDHPVAQWLRSPNPDTTTYRLIESLIADLALYFNAYWLKIRLDDGRIRLVRLPPSEMVVLGGLLRTGYLWTSQGVETPLATSDVCYFNGYNPLNALMGISPLDTLQTLLLEDAASARQRQLYWQNASRMEASSSVRKTRQWTPQRNSPGANNGGRASPPVKHGASPGPRGRHDVAPMSYSAKDSEYPRRMLTREGARAPSHPLPMVGILEHATFSNIKEQHKQLYADCSPRGRPWSKRYELQLVSDRTPPTSTLSSTSPRS